MTTTGEPTCDDCGHLLDSVEGACAADDCDCRTCTPPNAEPTRCLNTAKSVRGGYPIRCHLASGHGGECEMVPESGKKTRGISGAEPRSAQDMAREVWELASAAYLENGLTDEEGCRRASAVIAAAITEAVRQRDIEWRDAVELYVGRDTRSFVLEAMAPEDP